MTKEYVLDNLVLDHILDYALDHVLDLDLNLVPDFDHIFDLDLDHVLLLDFYVDHVLVFVHLKFMPKSAKNMPKEH